MYLEYTKKTSYERLLSVLNSIGSSVVAKYPMAEVQSWPILREEAIRKTQVPNEDQTVEMFPMIAEICKFQYGFTNNGALLAQIRDKADVILQNAIQWAGISAFVNGTRARAEILIDEAETEADVLDVLHSVLSDVEVFRAQYGV